ncbi:MAG: serine dehydratase [Xanthomonadales bacterium]|nr:serine dehydratase [Xanthomonadales bacterium]
MRGPSSSHCAASVRIGHLACDLMKDSIESVLIEFDPNGSLATTHDGQGSDMGLFGGLLGWDAADERLVNSESAIKEAGIKVEIAIRDIQASHPNTYKLTLTNSKEQHVLVANSTGGGMIELVSVDGIAFQSFGDYHETLILTASDPAPILQALGEDWDGVNVHGDGTYLIQVRGQQFVEPSVLDGFDIDNVFRLRPVLPVSSRKDMAVPFLTCDEMLSDPKNGSRSLSELAIDYESERGGLTRDVVLQKMTGIVQLLQHSIKEGVAGTEFEDRILHFQCGKFKEELDAGRLLDSGMLNLMVLYVTALMEVKSSMGIIVAAPTAGSCGALPGACLAAGEVMGWSEETMARGMLAAGLIGVFVTARSSFAAEVTGCQGETGVGAAMAAAALVDMHGGSLNQALAAASMALQNTLGLVCDPVANRVEVPCLGRNISAAANALTSANVALADFAEVIPLDEVIATHNTIGRGLPRELRCTCLGGLSITETAGKVERRLAR